jgi:hypothetical protein
MKIVLVAINIAVTFLIERFGGPLGRCAFASEIYVNPNTAVEKIIAFNVLLSITNFSQMIFFVVL